MTKEEARSAIMGAISMALKYPTLQQGFEIICKENAEFRKENEELKSRDCWKSCEYANPKSELIVQHIKDVQQLTKAKEIIKDFLLMAKVEHLKDRYETVDEAEQFISEVEK